jgi:hypothetical protein
MKETRPQTCTGTRKSGPRSRSTESQCTAIPNLALLTAVAEDLQMI